MSLNLALPEAEQNARFLCRPIGNGCLSVRCSVWDENFPTIYIESSFWNEDSSS